VASTVILGAGLMAVGHFMMAFEPLFLLALLTLILGNGAFKPNISTQVGGLHAARSANRFEALAPVRQGVRGCFGAIAPGVARGLKLRHDHGSNYMSGDFQDEIKCLGIEASPSFVHEPEGNGVAERFIRTLKENLLWVKTFDTIEQLRTALVETDPSSVLSARARPLAKARTEAEKASAMRLPRVSSLKFPHMANMAKRSRHIDFLNANYHIFFMSRCGEALRYIAVFRRDGSQSRHSPGHLPGLTMCEVWRPGAPVRGLFRLPGAFSRHQFSADYHHQYVRI
jgi:hypothetical protein